MKIISTSNMRPTTQKVREALSNIWREKIAGSKFLDLFAGVGSVGIEALRQGAAEVHLVENHPRVLKVLKHNLKGQPWAGTYKILALEVKSFLKHNKETYDLIFLDPPYGSTLAEETLNLLAAGHSLEGDGWVVVEHHHKTSLADNYAVLAKIKTYKYGETRISIFKRSAAAS
jgi:16S rRNA (guanine966-N2)-methyltransferase